MPSLVLSATQFDVQFDSTEEIMDVVIRLDVYARYVTYKNQHRKARGNKHKHAIEWTAHIKQENHGGD